MPTPKKSTIRTVLDGWDGDYVEVTLLSGLKQRGQISVFMTGDLVAVGVDTPQEVIYRIDQIAGVSWIADEDTSYSNDELTQKVAAARESADYDSNDEELQLLREALDQALHQLGREDLR